MSKYTKIFTTPYVPKYGPVPLSEVGQMMKERKQVIDASILQDEQTMAILDQVSIGLNEDEKNTLLSSVEPYYKDAQSRIQSGDYNLRDIDLQTRRDATRIAGIVQGFQGLKEQKQKDIDNFYKLNKDADPIQLQLMLSELGMPSIKMDEETGLPTLSHSIGNIKIPEFETPEVRDQRVLDPLKLQEIDQREVLGFDMGDLTIYEEQTIPKERKRFAAASPLVSGTEPIPIAKKLENITFDDLDKIKNESARSFAKAIASNFLDEDGNEVDNFGEKYSMAIENYIEQNSQIEEASYNVFNNEELDENRKRFIDNKDIYGQEFFIPSTGQRLNFEELFEEYGTGDYNNTKDREDFMKQIALKGETTDETGFYTLSGSGIVVNIGDVQAIMDKENVDQMDMETRQASNSLTNPYNFEPVTLTRAGTGEDSDQLFDVTIEKDVKFMLGNRYVTPDIKGAKPVTSYIVTMEKDGKTNTYTYNSFNRLFNKVLSPGERTQ
jgi:hypothetical protein